MSQTDREMNASARMRGAPADAVEQYQNDMDMSTSGAVRTLTKRGLVAEGYLDEHTARDSEYEGPPVKEMAENTRSELEQLRHTVREELDVRPPTLLARWMWEGARFSAFAALALTVIHLSTPLDFSMPVGALLSTSVAFALLKEREPMVSNWIGVTSDER